MEEFTYRLATLDDIPLIIETERLIKPEMGWKNQKDIDDSIKAEEKDLPYFLNEGTVVICFAYSGGTFAGMGGLHDWTAARTAPGYSNLAAGYFYTVPEFRNRGVMHGIAETLIQTANERGCDCVKVFTEDKYREALYARGFRDVYDEEEDIPMIENEMELSLKPQQEDYQRLQPFRIPVGWTVGLNKFEDIDPETLPADDKAWLFAFNEDILQIYCKLKRKRNKHIEQQELIIDLGWYPDGDPNGKFTIRAILDRDWYEPLLEFSSRSKDEIVKTLEKWLFVDFMPIRFIDKDE
ncbi:MAG: GNAT family N-acetyltransferase [Oscillospiraceae bacterium]|nr:GNAT family N-acetyltransferase [Oscillospiraceae bacterium]